LCQRAVGLICILALGTAGPALGQGASARENTAEPEPVPDVPPDYWTDGPGTVTEAEERDIQTVARQNGLSIEEATRHLHWQEPFTEMVSELRQKYPDEFAGARIEDFGEGAWIAFSAEVPPEAASMANAFAASFGASVNAHADRGFDEAGLDATLTASHQSVWARQDLVRDVSSGYDIVTGEVQISVESRGATNKDERERERRALSADLPPEVVLEVVERGHRGGLDNIYGAVPLSTCTVGFSTSADGASGGNRGIATADHCDDTQVYDGRLPLEFQYAHTSGTWGDVQWHKGSEYEYDDFYADVGDLRDVSERGFAVEGKDLCKNGKSTRKTCDKVYQLNHCRNDYCHLTAMHNRYASGGDSGGPWFWGNTAYGIHSGYKWWNFKDRDLFTPTDYLSNALGIHVATS